MPSPWCPYRYIFRYGPYFVITGCLEEAVSILSFVLFILLQNQMCCQPLLKLNDSILMFKLNFSRPCFWKWGSCLMTLGLQTCTQLNRKHFGILYHDNYLYLILKVVWWYSFWMFLAVSNNSSTVVLQRKGCWGNCQDNYVEGQPIIDLYFP